MSDESDTSDETVTSDAEDYEKFMKSERYANCNEETKKEIVERYEAKTKAEEELKKLVAEVHEAKTKV